MKLSFRFVYEVMALLFSAAAASATPMVWTLNGIRLNDGGTVSGTFAFNPESGIPCGSFSPCGTYSNVDIVTTGGSSRTGASYSLVCGQDVTTCTGLSLDSTEVLFLTSNAANQSGDSAIAFFFTGIGVIPPQGLTADGGVLAISGSSGNVGTIQEANCLAASCSAPSPPVRFSTAGTASATAPEPASWLLLFAGFAVLFGLFVGVPRAGLRPPLGHNSRLKHPTATLRGGPLLEAASRF